MTQSNSDERGDVVVREIDERFSSAYNAAAYSFGGQEIEDMADEFGNLLRAYRSLQQRERESVKELVESCRGLLHFLKVSVNAGPMSKNPRMEIRHLENIRQSIARLDSEQNDRPDSVTGNKAGAESKDSAFKLAAHGTELPNNSRGGHEHNDKVKE